MFNRIECNYTNTKMIECNKFNLSYINSSVRAKTHLKKVHVLN